MKNKKCPVCYGTGYLDKRPKFVDEIFRLKEEGLNYQQIAKAIGFSSPNTVFYHIKKWKKI